MLGAEPHYQVEVWLASRDVNVMNHDLGVAETINGLI